MISDIKQVRKAKEYLRKRRPDINLFRLTGWEILTLYWNERDND